LIAWHDHIIGASTLKHVGTKGFLDTLKSCLVPTLFGYPEKRW